MGNSSSCNVDNAAAGPATAKLVTQDGALQEFAWPVKASHVLQKDPACFVCDADDMVLDGFVSAVGADDELRQGQLYFLLPASVLRRPLLAEEMAALALKANAALVGKRASFAAPPVLLHSPMPAAKEGGSRKVNARRKSGKGRDFTSDLRAIPE